MSVPVSFERPAFYFSEQTLWFSTQQSALVLPVGGWVQPMVAGGHADSPEPKRRTKSLAEVSGVMAEYDPLAAPAAGADVLLAIHPQDYLDRFKATSDAGGGALHPTAPFAAGSYEIALLSAGQVIGAVLEVAEGRRRRAYAVSRPSGHHCMPDMPMGFCLIANVAVAVRAAQAAGRKRIAVLDWDVHHGNGTEACFYDDPTVLTVSMHQAGCFPPGDAGTMEAKGSGDGEGFNLNVPLWPGSGHAVYMAALHHIVLPTIRDFQPDMIVVVNGLDANAVDPLARMLLSSESFKTMTESVVGLADELCGGRIAIIHEGGYSDAYVPFCAHAVLAALAGRPNPVTDPFLPIVEAQQPGADFDKAQFDALRTHPLWRD
ncbi:class II histone deacetylase [Rhizobium sp. ACO-34A]|nr:class II histone deacetylase [Rhizobium sp. ACO-34A]ATN32289.1 class II histone deacetylase [Rhizobium sp. ACO-34A]